MLDQTTRMLTTAEAASVLSVTERRVQAMIRAGRLPNAVKAGRDWLIPESDIESVKVRKPGRPRKETTL